MSHDLLMPPCVLERWKVEIQNVNARLLAWSKTVPEHWRPPSLSRGRDFDCSMPSFHSTCEIYSFCQIASIWNLWRSYRILRLKIMLNPFCSVSSSEQIDSTGETMLDLNIERYRSRGLHLYGNTHHLNRRPPKCLRSFNRFACPIWPCAGLQISHARQLFVPDHIFTIKSQCETVTYIANRIALRSGTASTCSVSQIRLGADMYKV